MTKRTILRHARRLSLLLMALSLAACGGREADAGDRPDEPAATGVDRDDRDHVQEPAGEPDPELAPRGEQLFAAKACVGCHTIGKGRLTGPDLAGVTERRSRVWTLAMITNPDSMLKNDATARQLFMEYATPMANMNVSPDEARALYEYLRAQGSAQ